MPVHQTIRFRMRFLALSLVLWRDDKKSMAFKLFLKLEHPLNDSIMIWADMKCQSAALLTQSLKMSQSVLDEKNDRFRELCILCIIDFRVYGRLRLYDIKKTYITIYYCDYCFHMMMNLVPGKNCLILIILTRLFINEIRSLDGNLQSFIR